MPPEPLRSDRPLTALTIGEAIRDVADALGQTGVESPAREARLLVAAAIGEAPLALLAEPHRPLMREAAAALAAMLARRTAREPISRILGRRGFYGRDFEISPDVLDPRPETETLVDAALSIAAEEGWRDTPIRILDIGTGSGCLLVTLLAELPLATGLGTDISAAALSVARANARRHGVAGRARWQQARALAGVSGLFDLVLSNPPYIATGDIGLLEPEVRLHDPWIALDGGSDGLKVYREILTGLSDATVDGWVLFEVGAGQAGPVTELIRKALSGRHCLIRTSCDLAGQIRCVAWKARA
ncbi:MAG TPA: peptide chain release factor N(5)-glutamine methyltransferase [Hyphomicrobiaceae bacterium]|nr:peptide chain release factor N(5)-glutamine methyltransferase [Hyphomicrobiaceae bacterium]